VIAHLRGESSITRKLLDLLGTGHSLGTSCVNVAELERGLRPKERRAAAVLLSRLSYLETSREAALRAGRYQRDWGRVGRTLHTADALVAGTARAHGAVLVTDNRDDFPRRDLQVMRPEDL